MRDLLPKYPTDVFFEAEQAEEQGPRWQKCIAKAETNMGMALSVMLIKDLLKNNDQKQVILLYLYEILQYTSHILQCTPN